MLNRRGNLKALAFASAVVAGGLSFSVQAHLEFLQLQAGDAGGAVLLEHPFHRDARRVEAGDAPPQLPAADLALVAAGMGEGHDLLQVLPQSRTFEFRPLLFACRHPRRHRTALADDGGDARAEERRWQWQAEPGGLGQWLSMEQGKKKGSEEERNGLEPAIRQEAVRHGWSLQAYDYYDFPVACARFAARARGGLRTIMSGLPVQFKADMIPAQS